MTSYHNLMPRLSQPCNNLVTRLLQFQILPGNKVVTRLWQSCDHLLVTILSLPSDLVTPCFQVLFTVSGCDYISYFAGFSKAAFMNVCNQHACFTTGDEEKGRLSDCCTSDLKKGYLAFLRLIGTLLQKALLSICILTRNRNTTTFNEFYFSNYSVKAAQSIVQWHQGCSVRSHYWWGSAYAIWISNMETLATVMLDNSYVEKLTRLGRI